MGVGAQEGMGTVAVFLKVVAENGSCPQFKRWLSPFAIHAVWRSPFQMVGVPVLLPVVPWLSNP
jgi:hypothetical protein